MDMKIGLGTGQNLWLSMLVCSTWQLFCYKQLHACLSHETLCNASLMHFFGQLSQISTK